MVSTNIPKSKQIDDITWMKMSMYCERIFGLSAAIVSTETRNRRLLGEGGHDREESADVWPNFALCNAAICVSSKALERIGSESSVRARSLGNVRTVESARPPRSRH